MQVLYVRPRFVRRFFLLAVTVAMFVVFIGQILAWAETPTNSSWTSPAAPTLRRVSALSNVQNKPTFLNNLDCSPLTYRLVGSSTMRTGCFTDTAFGMLDSDHEIVIFNGTDEGLPLTSFSPHQVLAPWPGALNLVTLDASSYGGSYLGMYKNPLSLLRDQRNFYGQLTGKQLTAPPEELFKDPAGQRLRINAQTMSFSSGGSWLVAETLNGSFVRVNLATLDTVAFAPAFGSTGSPGLLQSYVGVSNDGRFVGIANAVAKSFKVYDLSACAPGSSTQHQNCRSYEYWPSVSGQVFGLQSVRRIRFINDQLLNIEVFSGNAVASGVYTLATAGSMTALTDYLGLGDSYTSGEGAFNYLLGTDTDKNKCHLSARSYPLLLARDVFSPAGGHSVACSGAVINDIGSSSNSYRGQVKGGVSFDELMKSGNLGGIISGFSPGQIAQRHFVKHYQPKVVTASIGGNDIGFGQILQKCVMPRVSLRADNSDCYNTYESRAELLRLIDRTVPRWTSLYKQLRSDNPGGQLYIIGYPSIASDIGKCGLNVHLSENERRFSNELIAYLNDSIHKAASTAGADYVDIGKALEGHRLCEAKGYAVAINGLTAGNDHGIFGINVLGRESYHPNALGHELIAQAILKQTNNLALKNFRALTNPVVPDSQSLLNVPKSGAVIHDIVPYELTNPLVRRGMSVPVRVDGLKAGLKPNATYMIHLDGPGGPRSTTPATSSTGDIDTVVAMPATTEPGSHTIDIIGTGQTGEPVNVTQPIYVPGDPNDADGDGFSDSSDSCPYAINSRQDADQDALDDACDSLIGEPPSAPVTPAHTGSSEPQPGKPSPASDLQAVGVLQSTSQALEPSSNAAGSASVTVLTTRSSAIHKRPLRGITLPAARSSQAPPMVLSAQSVRNHGIARPAVKNADQGAPAVRPLKTLLLVVGTCFALFGSMTAGYFIRLRHRKTNTLRSIPLLNSRLCSTIVLMRKFGTFLLAVILFISLIGLALAVASNLAFTNPAKVKGWLNQSNLYGNVIADATKAQEAGGDSGPTIPLSDPGIQKIAQSTFSSELLQKNVDTVVDSNYAWLEGKKNSPEFRVDLAPAKEAFAERVGSYVESRLSELQICTAEQLSRINTEGNPLSLECRPASMDPETVGSETTDQISNSAAFLSDPVITASNLNPKGDSEQQPYYQGLSGLPAVYQFGTKLPLIAALVTFASIIGVIFIPKNHKNGVRVVGIVLLLAGLVLIAVKLVLNQIFDVVHSNLFSAGDNDRVQQAVVDFLQRAEHYLANIEFWFGIAYVTIAVIIFFTLRRKGRQADIEQPSLISDSDAQTPTRTNPIESQPPAVQAEDIRLKPRPSVPGSNTTTPRPPRRPKPPRLIQ